MLKDLINYLKRKDEIKEKNSLMSFDSSSDKEYKAKKIEEAYRKSFQRPLPAETMENVAMDSDIKLNFANNTVIPENIFSWFSSQGFIGWQMCAILSQHWLISKCCLMPAKDAVRKGYEITVNDGTEIDPKILDALAQYDIDYGIKNNLVELINKGRIFGIRVAMFKVESNDPDYYKKPFNLDGVTAGSYKGISQIDPYWISPELDKEGASDPSSIYFYDPTWWRIGGVRIHRSHLIIYRTEEPADMLKPSYFYGGIPIPQKIYERVYAAERTANEAPLLAMTKRTSIFKTDLTQAVADQANFQKNLEWQTRNANNHAVKIIGYDDEMTQLDTSLADLDTLTMTQYQLVAADANVPAVKLLGTAPKGFNSTGEFEEASYHEELESIQAHDMTPLIQRHHELIIRSEICPRFNIKPFSTSVIWKSLDSMTAKEQAELNKIKADTALVEMQAGAIDGEEERNRLIKDPDSGYSGLENISLENEDLEDNDGI